MIHGTEKAPSRKISFVTFSIYIFAFTFAVFVFPNNAWSLWGDTGGAFGLDGYFRLTAVSIDGSKLPGFLGEPKYGYFIQTEARFMASGRPNDTLSYEIHLSQFLEKFSDTGTGGVENSKTRYRVFAGKWQQSDADDSTLYSIIDRMNLKLTLNWADLIIGRQAITFGKAYFWNPLDRFLPFSAGQVNRDYKKGVDGVRLDLPMGAFSGLSLLAALGPETPDAESETDENAINSSWYGSAVMARFFTTLHEWDLAASGGKVYGGYLLGVGASGELGTVEVRFEAAYFKAKNSPSMPFPFEGRLYEDNLTVVAGFGRRFENSFFFETEFLYNQLGTGKDIDLALFRAAEGVILHAGKYMGGLLIGYDILPILTLQAVLIYNFSDNSSMLQPILTLSISDDSELVLGASISRGSAPELDNLFIPRIRAEFGVYPDFYYVEFKYYF